MKRKIEYKRTGCLLKCLFLLSVILLGSLLTAGCGAKKEEPKGAYRLYYIDAEKLTLTKEAYEPEGTTAEAQIEEILQKLRTNPEKEELQTVFINDVNVENWTLENETLKLYFNESYRTLDKPAELLLRAAVVESLVQVPEVKGVEFFISGEVLTDKAGNPVGIMTGEDFVRNTGSSLHSYQSAALTLYFASKEGDHLIRQSVNVRYNSNTSKEKLTVEQLLKTRSSAEWNAVIPQDTVLLGVSIKDGVCYVNFDEGFLAMSDVAPKLTIYAIVNSIIENGEANQVQILVNGETNVNYQGSVDLSKPLTEDLTLIAE